MPLNLFPLLNKPFRLHRWPFFLILFQEISLKRIHFTFILLLSFILLIYMSSKKVIFFLVLLCYCLVKFIYLMTHQSLCVIQSQNHPCRTVVALFKPKIEGNKSVATFLKVIFPIVKVKAQRVRTLLLWCTPTPRRVLFSLYIYIYIYIHIYIYMCVCVCVCVCVCLYIIFQEKKNIRSH